MQFLVMMRDGSRFVVEAAYIEVVSAQESSYTLLGPVPGYERAILATFPVDLVTAIIPAEQISEFVPAPDQGVRRGGRAGRRATSYDVPRSPEEDAFEMAGWTPAEADF